MANPPLHKPHIERQILNGAKDEFFALKAVFRFYGYMPILLLLGLSVCIYKVRPPPPRTVTIATGRPLSTYDDLGKWYKEPFLQYGARSRRHPG